MKIEEAIDVLKRMRIALATANVDGIRVLQPLNVAIESCEKQVAKSVVKPYKTFQSNTRCGVCKSYVHIITNNNYCGECGNKLKWREE